MVMQIGLTLVRWFYLPFAGRERRRRQAWLDLAASSEHIKRDLGLLDCIITRRHN